MWRTWILAGLVAMGYVDTSLAQTEKSDSVFIDEGDGDFDPVPSVHPNQPVAKPVPVAPVAEPSVSPEVAPVATQETPAEAKPEKSAPEKKAKKAKAAKADKAVKPAKSEEPAPATESADAKPVVEEKAPAKPSKAAKAPKGDPGIFVTTKAVCPIRREPAGEAEQIATTKSPRKIWVQKVDDNWVRAFTKSGDPGYISTDCFE